MGRGFCFARGRLRVGQPDSQLDQPAKGRRTKAPPKGQLGVVEGIPSPCGRGDDRGMVGLVGLHDGAALAHPPPRTPDGLDEQLVGALCGTLIGQVQGYVRRDDPDQRHRWDIEPLGHEARPDEDVEAAVREGIDHALRGAPMFDDIAIEAAHPQGRQGIPDLALKALRAATQVADTR